MPRSFAHCYFFFLVSLTPNIGAHAKPDAPQLLYIDSRANATEATGSQKFPFSHPQDALQWLENRNAAMRKQPVLIHVAAGTYPITRPLRIDSRHAGTAVASVRWLARGEVIWTGARPVPPASLKAVQDTTTLSRLPKSADTHTSDHQLYRLDATDLGIGKIPPLHPRGFAYPEQVAWPEFFQNSRPLPLASWPNGIGYAGGKKPARIVQAGRTSETKHGTVHRPRSMAFTLDDKHQTRVKRWQTAIEKYHASMWLGGHWYHDWADEYLACQGIDQEGVITTQKRPRGYGLGPHANIHIYNLLEEVDTPMEYVIDPSQQCFFLYLPKNKPPKISLTQLDEAMLQIDGAEFLSFEGIQFIGGRSHGVLAHRVNQLQLSHCQWQMFGGNGVVANGKHIHIRDCSFKQLGAAGVIVRGGQSDTLSHANNIIEYCHFHTMGRLRRTYAGGVSLGGVGNTLQHCLIENLPHLAISFHGQEHTIQHNEIRQALLEVGDAGAIYSGRSWTGVGTRIHGNWLHQLGGIQGRGTSAIYLDDQLSGIHVSRNLIESAEIGVLVGGGRHNVIEHNILVRCLKALHLDQRGAAAWALHMRPTLRRRLASTPIHQEPWKSRYPWLKDIPTEGDTYPANTLLQHNLAIRCQSLWHRRELSGVAKETHNRETQKNLNRQGNKLSHPQLTQAFHLPQVGPRPRTLPAN